MLQMTFCATNDILCYKLHFVLEMTFCVTNDILLLYDKSCEQILTESAPLEARGAEGPRLKIKRSR